MKNYFIRLSFVVLLLLSIKSRAQLIDSSFNPTDLGFDSGGGFQEAVNSIVVQTDAKILVGGNFTRFRETTTNYIARLNTDGSPDINFNPGTGFDNYVQAMAIQSNGKIIVGGSFKTFNGTGRNYIARLNIDGSLDASFNPGMGFNNTVYSLAIQADGKIVAGGAFTTFNGIIRKYIVRLNEDGSLDTGFNPGTGFDNYVNAIAIQPDGRVIAGGYFTVYNGTPVNYIVRVLSDGSLDTGFNQGTGFNNSVSTIAVQTDGEIVVGGNFTSYKGSTRNYLARVYTDGDLDMDYNTGGVFNHKINSIVIQSDGKVLAAGSLIARVNMDGSLDAGFNPDSGFDNFINCITVQTDGKIVAGGLFTSFKGTPEYYIARLHTDASLDIGFNRLTGANGDVSAIAVQTDGKIILGGAFKSYNGVARNRIVRLNPDGSVDSGFDPGTGFNFKVWSIAIQADGNILVAGAFDSYNGISRHGIVRLHSDGSIDTGFNPGTGFMGSGFNIFVNSIAVQSDGKILAVGHFTTYNGVARNNLVRLNSDGSLDTDFNQGTGFDFFCSTIALQEDNKIILGGAFNSYAGTARNRIVRLNTDGTLDQSFDPGTGFNNAVRSVNILPDGKLLVYGDFYSFNGISVNHLARLNANGSLDTGFIQNTNNSIASIAVQADGNILAAGTFIDNSGILRSKIVRLNPNGSSDTNFDSGMGFDELVSTIVIQSDGKILAGGSFTSYNGTGRNRIARLLNCIAPLIPALSSAQNSICSGGSTTLSVTSGGLNNAEDWQWYTGSCAGTPAGTGTSVTVTPTVTTTYYARGEGGCVTPGYCASITVTVSVCTGMVQERSTFDLFIYPSPSDGNITVSSFYAGGILEVYNNAGIIVYSKELNGTDTELMLQGLVKGVYEVRLCHDKGVSTGKIVIQ